MRLFCRVQQEKEWFIWWRSGKYQYSLDWRYTEPLIICPHFQSVVKQSQNRLRHWPLSSTVGNETFILWRESLFLLPVPLRKLMRVKVWRRLDLCLLFWGYQSHDRNKNSLLKVCYWITNEDDWPNVVMYCPLSPFIILLYDPVTVHTD